MTRHDLTRVSSKGGGVAETAFKSGVADEFS